MKINSSSIVAGNLVGSVIYFFSPHFEIIKSILNVAGFIITYESVIIQSCLTLVAGVLVLMCSLVIPSKSFRKP
jgi:hypothetical protein